MKFFALIAAAALLFSACQKDITGGEGDPDPVTKVEGKHLIKYTYSSPGFIRVDSFVYDGQNRCIRTYHAASATAAGAPYFYDFHYNGSDTLPYKITDTSEGRDMIWLVQYDGQNKKIADSIVYTRSDEKFVAYYTYSANRIVSRSAYSRAGSVQTVAVDTFDLSGNNCARYSAVANQQGNPFDWQYAMTYDTKINPYSTLNIARVVYFGANNIAFATFDGLNKNNYLTLSYTTSNPGIPAGTTNYQYVYDADGYPLTSAFTNIANPAGSGTEKFEYKQ